MGQVYEVKYKTSGSRCRTLVLQADSEEEARCNVMGIISKEQMDNNLFVNVDYVKVKLFTRDEYDWKKRKMQIRRL